MINGYVTYEELKVVTGFDNLTLNKMIQNGLALREFEFTPVDGRTKCINKQLFNLQEVFNWIKLHIY